MGISIADICGSGGETEPELSRVTKPVSSEVTQGSQIAPCSGIATATGTTKNASNL